MSKSDREFVDFKAIKAAVSMVQILEHYGLMDKMRRSGDRISGCCPIHKGENKTAFRVSVEKNCWNCFSDCKCGGNVLDFVSKMEGIDILEAALLIKGWFKLKFDRLEREPDERPRSPAPPKQAAADSKKKVEQPENTSGENVPLKFTLNHLEKDHPYLKERGLTSETIATFGLGFCKKGIMAGHVAIPVHNAKGELVAYAGRFPGEPPNPDEKYKLPKGFKKSLEVFNFHRAAQVGAEHPLVIVQGFFGCMKLWQAGVLRVVSLMGSTLCEPQEALIVKLISREQRVILLFDEDDAGRICREQALQRFASKAYVRVVEFEKEGTQPDNLTPEEIDGLALREQSPAYDERAEFFGLVWRSTWQQPFRLRVNDIVIIGGKLGRVIRVTDCSAVVLINRSVR